MPFRPTSGIPARRRGRGERGAPVRRVMRFMAGRPARRGRGAARFAAVLGLALLPAGCNYGLSSGGGFDATIRTLYIQPFENTTPRFDLETQLYQVLTTELPGQLGLTTGSEQNADAMLRGRITRFDEVARTTPGEAGTINADEFQVQIVVSVELIDRRRNVIVWDGSSVTGRGDYFASRESDTAAIEEALKSILDQIVNGAQSRW